MSEPIIFPGGVGSRRAKVYRTAVRELRTTSAPRVLAVLDDVEIPESIEISLRAWLAELALPERTATLAPEILQDAFAKLSVLFLSAFSYQGVPSPNRRLRSHVDLILTQQADADAVRLAQLRIAEILVNGYGPAGAARLKAAHARERENLRRLSWMIARHAD